MPVTKEDMRKVFKEKRRPIREEDLPKKDPFVIFDDWFKDAVDTSDTYEEAYSACIATSTKEGKPSCRMLLLKGHGNDGYLFSTSYLSRKAKDLEENPYVAASFFWPKLIRSIRIEGIVEKANEADSEQVFRDRDDKGQASALLSEQSSDVPCREFLAEQMEEIMNKYVAKGLPIPRPKTWGGYVLKPTEFEFWQGHSDRLHDRLIFRKEKSNDEILGEFEHRGENGWIYRRLAP